jgi:hypothetical protein
VNNIEAARLLAVLAAGFPNFNLQKETVAVYANQLEDLSYSDGEVAIGNLLKTEDWFPTISKIRKEILLVGGGLSPSREQAWIEVQYAIAHKGHTGKPEWTHDAVSEAVRCIGWTNLCLSQNQETTRAHFFKAYDGISQRTDRAAQTGYKAELENGSGNYKLQLENVVKSV